MVAWHGARTVVVVRGLMWLVECAGRRTFDPPQMLPAETLRGTLMPAVAGVSGSVHSAALE